MTTSQAPKIVTIVGTNASGKSAVGLKLAQKYNGEIISADSRQIYRNFDLCSGKVTPEESKVVPHHLIDICDIGTPFSVADFQTNVYSLIPQIIQRGKVPFIVGGTGLYVSSVVYGYVLTPETYDSTIREKLENLSVDELWKMLPQEGVDYLSKNESDSKNKRRIIRVLEKLHNNDSLEPQNEPRYETLQLGVTWPREILDKRIEDRLSARINQGMIEEVKAYLDGNGNPEFLDKLGLEYRYILWYLTGKYSSLDEFYTEMSRAIKRFSKKQLTWFRKDKSIHWIDMEGDYIKQASNLIDTFLNV